MPPSQPVLVLGTYNSKKRQELAELFRPLGFALRTLADFPNAIEVEETGDTFVANARLKGAEQARNLGAWVLGEDSGLAVDALDGRPGVYSARYSDPGATDERNNAKLLGELAGVPWERRGAHYVCCMALSDPSGQIAAESQGRCHGRIRTEAAGAGGFGYDPLFEVLECHRTFGELGPAVKRALSHRARAARQLIPQLEALRISGRFE